MLPALVAVAVKITCVPLHTVVKELAILTAGALVGLTVITTGAEVAAAGEAQPDEEVMTTRTVSPLVRLAEVKVLPVPCAAPFTYH